MKVPTTVSEDDAIRSVMVGRAYCGVITNDGKTTSHLMVPLSGGRA